MKSIASNHNILIINLRNNTKIKISIWKIPVSEFEKSDYTFFFPHPCQNSTVHATNTDEKCERKLNDHSLLQVKKKSHNNYVHHHDGLLRVQQKL